MEVHKITDGIKIDRTSIAFPSYLEVFQAGREFVVPEHSTVYGWIKGAAEVHKSLLQGPLCFSVSKGSVQIKKGYIVAFVRNQFVGQNILGVELEDEGRLKYIDGCSDSLLIYPPRLGDPSLNYLYFPEHTNQTFHSHPSVRLGCVVKGSGFACLKDKELKLSEGDLFCLEPNETHRFRTEHSQMAVIAFHPEGDWGPTDEIHPMINRTIIT
jgi:quercetin dioxygenase-like cupin family protein